MDVINRALAQKMVNTIMNTVPYNINIINENGIIIASGHPERIGHTHEAGLLAIRENSLKTVTEITGHMKPGVNMPIRYHEKICGAVGISGLVDEVMPLASLVKCTIELLMEQETTLSDQRNLQVTRVQFLHEWLALGEEPGPDFVQRGLLCQVAVTSDEAVALLRLPYSEVDMLAGISWLENHFRAQCPSNYAIRMDSDLVAVLLSSAYDAEEQLAMLGNKFTGCHIGIGNREAVLHRSYDQALSTLRIGSFLRPSEHIHYYDSCYRYFDAMLYGMKKLGFPDEPVSTAELLKAESGHVLLDTLICFYENNGEQKKTTEALHVHRNTLDYRLNKICQITKLDPKVQMDLFHLMCDYLISSGR